MKKYQLIQKLQAINSEIFQIENVNTNSNKLITNKKSRWDYVLETVVEKVNFRNQKKKYTIAIKAFYAKKCQRKLRRRQLKKEEIILFHRIISSRICQKVMQKFTRIQAGFKDQSIRLQQHSVKTKGKQLSILNMSNLFVKYQHKNKLQNIQEHANISKKWSIQKYMILCIQENDVINQQRINQKQFLRKIKQNVIKRQNQKSKSSQKDQKSLNNLNQAELILYDLIIQKQENLSIEQLLALNVINKGQQQNTNPKPPKRKKKQPFKLSWNREIFEEMKQLNPTADQNNFNYSNMNELLTIFLKNDNTNYSQMFQKSLSKVQQLDHNKIKHKFPQTIHQINKSSYSYSQNLKSNPDQQSQKKFKEQFCNSELLLKNFIQNSKYLFSTHTIQQEKNTNMEIELEVQAFFNKCQNFNPQESIIKCSDNTITIIDKQLIEQGFDTKDKVNSIELYFLIMHYISKIGNDWELISYFLGIHPLTRSLKLNSLQVENLYYYYNLKNKQNIFWSNKIILPHRSDFQEQYHRRSRENQKIEIQEEEVNLQNYEEYVNKMSANEEIMDSGTDIGKYDQQFDIFKSKVKLLGLSSKDTLIDHLTDKQESSKKNDQIIQALRYPSPVSNNSNKIEQENSFEFIGNNNKKINEESEGRITTRKIITERKSQLSRFLSRPGRKVPDSTHLFYGGIKKKSRSLTLTKKIIPISGQTLIDKTFNFGKKTRNKKKNRINAQFEKKLFQPLNYEQQNFNNMEMEIEIQNIVKEKQQKDDIPHIVASVLQDLCIIVEKQPAQEMDIQEENINEVLQKEKKISFEQANINLNNNINYKQQQKQLIKDHEKQSPDIIMVNEKHDKPINMDIGKDMKIKKDEKTEKEDKNKKKVTQARLIQFEKKIEEMQKQREQLKQLQTMNPTSQTSIAQRTRKRDRNGKNVKNNK